MGTRSCSGRRRARSATRSAGSTSPPGAASSSRTPPRAGHARRARAGQETLCESLFPLLNGAYAELLLVPERIARLNLLPVPAGLASEVAAMAEPLACCLHGVDVAGVQHGDTVAIVGAGPIGLMLCACVADAGGRPVIVGGRPERRELAPLFGAGAGEPRGGRRRDRGGRDRGGLGLRARARPARRHGARVRRAPGRIACRGRPVPDPLRGGPARRRVPSHPAPLPLGTWLPRERRVPVRAARDAPASGSRASRRSSTIRPATTSRPPSGRRRCLRSRTA